MLSPQEKVFCWVLSNPFFESLCLAVSVKMKKKKKKIKKRKKKEKKKVGGGAMQMKIYD